MYKNHNSYNRDLEAASKVGSAACTDETIATAGHATLAVKTSQFKGFLFSLMLISTAIPLAAQNDETTVTTTTKSVSAPVAPPPPDTTVSTTTTSISAKTRTLYLRSSYHGEIKNGSQVFIRPNGRIYDEDATCVGHLTDLNGDDLRMIPDDHRYKIRNLNGHVIASTKMTSDFDNDRTVTLARQDSDGHLITETTETTSTTAPLVPVVLTTPVQSSTTTTTTQAEPDKQTSP